MLVYENQLFIPERVPFRSLAQAGSGETMNALSRL